MARLEEICSLITDGSHFSPEDEGVGYPMFSVKDMTPNGFNISGCKKIGEEAYKKLVANGCKPLNDDVVVAKDGSYLKTAFVIKGNPEITLLSSIAILRPKIDLVVPEYLSYFLKSDAVYRTVSLNYITGTALKRIILKGIRKIEVDLPDIGEQEQRAQRLSKVDYLCQLRKQQLAKLDELVKARFVEMFGEPSSNPMGWLQTTVGAECYYIKDGPHKSLTDVGMENGYPFISVRNIVNGYIDFSTAKYISEADYKDAIKKCCPEKGDILYSKGGTTGIAKLVDIDIKFANWVHLAVLKFNHNEFNGSFFEKMLNCDYCYKQSQMLTKGIANRDLVLSAMAQIKIYKPPILLQNQFAAFVERVDQQKQTVQQSLEKLELMKKALMQEYFG